MGHQSLGDGPTPSRSASAEWRIALPTTGFCRVRWIFFSMGKSENVTLHFSLSSFQSLETIQEMMSHSKEAVPKMASIHSAACVLFHNENFQL